LSYLQSLKPNPKTIGSDAVSGFATGLFSIPEGMAYAQLAGVNPVYGLYSGMVATVVAAMSTGTILMISTLTSAIALSIASVLSVAGIDPNTNPNAIFTITLLVGATMFVAGLLRLGKLVSFVSNAVMTGFVMGASLLIIIGELGDFAGYEPSGTNDLAEVVDWFANIGQWDPTTTIIGVVTIILVLVLKRIPQTERMASIISLLVMSVVVYVLSLSVTLVGDIADIPGFPDSLPLPKLPDFSLIPDLALGSVSVAIVALVQGAGISTAYPNPDKSKSSQSRDFLGEGLGNLVGSFFQSMATGGSLSRTGISVSGGAKSRWGGIFAGLWLLALVAIFGSLAELVPMAVIAGLLFVIGAELIMARIPDLILVHRTSWGSAAALWLTFLSALFIPLQYTIFLGVGLSLLLYIWASSQEVRVRQLVRTQTGRYEEQDVPEVLPSNEATALNLGGHDFYAEVPLMEEMLPSTQGTENAVLILRMRGREQAASTGIKWLRRYAQEMRGGGNLLMLAGVQPHMMEELVRTETLEIIGKENVFPAEPDLGAALDKAREAAAEWLASPKDSSTGEGATDEDSSKAEAE
jgi:SulP family sulfate permease